MCLQCGEQQVGQFLCLLIVSGCWWLVVNEAVFPWNVSIIEQTIITLTQCLGHPAHCIVVELIMGLLP